MTRIVVTGATGQLGQELVLVATAAGHEVVGLRRGGPEGFDLADPAAIRRAITAGRPGLVLHAAAWTAVDDCEADPALALALNGEATGHVVAAAESVGAHVVHVSTDYVFDGTKAGPYLEDDQPAPRSAYGRSKLAGEQAVGPQHTVVRTAWLCGQHGPNMVRTILRLAASHDRLRFVDDQVGNPTFTADLAPALLELGLLRAGGTFHVTNGGATSWFGFARSVLVAAGLDPQRVSPISTSELTPPRPAPRPANSVLADTARPALGLAPLRHHEGPLAELVAACTS